MRFASNNLIIPTRKLNWLTNLRDANVPAEYTLRNIKAKIIKEFLNIIILMEMTKRENISGYDIIDLVNIKFSEPLSPGTVYSTLYAIERKGLIYGETDGRKTVYKLTQKGLNIIEDLKKSKDELAEMCKKIYID
jgi:DNA-binding PadR family transcriptional regulator